MLTGKRATSSTTNNEVGLLSNNNRNKPIPHSNSTEFDLYDHDLSREASITSTVTNVDSEKDEESYELETTSHDVSPVVYPIDNVALEASMFSLDIYPKDSFIESESIQRPINDLTSEMLGERFYSELTPPSKDLLNKNSGIKRSIEHFIKELMDIATIGLEKELIFHYEPKFAESAKYALNKIFGEEISCVHVTKKITKLHINPEKAIENTLRKPIAFIDNTKKAINFTKATVFIPICAGYDKALKGEDFNNVVDFYIKKGIPPQNIIVFLGEFNNVAYPAEELQAQGEEGYREWLDENSVKCNQTGINIITRSALISSSEYAPQRSVVESKMSELLKGNKGNDSKEYFNKIKQDVNEYIVRLIKQLSPILTSTAVSSIPVVATLPRSSNIAHANNRSRFFSSSSSSEVYLELVGKLVLDKVEETAKSEVPEEQKGNIINGYSQFFVGVFSNLRHSEEVKENSENSYNSNNSKRQVKYNRRN